MANRCTIYRLTTKTDLDAFNSSGDPDDISSVLRIDFNYNPTTADLKNSKKANQWIREFEIDTIHSIGDQQGAEKEMGDQEDLSVAGRVWDIEAILTARNIQSGNLAKLFTWADESSIVKDHWPDGRFGIYYEGDTTNELKPLSIHQTPPAASPRGLVITRYKKKELLGKNQVQINLQFRESRGE